MRVVPQTVRARVTVAATFAAVVVLAAVGWGLAVNLLRSLTENLDEQLSDVADELADEVADGGTPDVDGLGEEDWTIDVIGADGTVEAASERPDDDDPMRVLSRTAETPDGPVTIRVAAPSDDIDESVATLQRSLLVAVPRAATALGVLTWVLVGRTLRPVERIRAEVAEIGGGDLDRRVPVPAADDEIGRLARTMNDMLGRVEEAHERQRRFVADASHELRGPLTRMRTELEVDLEHPATADTGATQRSVLEEVVGLQQLVDDLLVLARSDGAIADAGGAATVDLAALAGRAVGRTRRRRGVVVELATVGAARATGRGAELERAIGNLLDNAVRHAFSTVRVTVSRNGDTVSVAVEDDGEGIPAAERDRVFERFARVDAARSAGEGGAGLGLSIARDIVERHGGTIVVDANYDSGARFVVALPAAGPASGPPA
jgi:signal transduction histidine kinase